MQLKSYRGGKFSTAEFDSAPFGEKVMFRTLKEAADMYQSNQRQGTVFTRTRREVSGSNKKPWKQKHTGRARAGDKKSNIWRGGGTTFGPKQRDWRYEMPVKARRVALRSALAGKLRDGEVVLAELGAFAKPSAKAARALITALRGGKQAEKQAEKRRVKHASRRVLFVLADHDPNVTLSFRNFPGVSVRTARELNALDVLLGGLLVAQPGALERVAERVAKTKKSA